MDRAFRLRLLAAEQFREAIVAQWQASAQEGDARLSEASSLLAKAEAMSDATYSSLQRRRAQSVSVNSPELAELLNERSDAWEQARVSVAEARERRVSADLAHRELAASVDQFIQFIDSESQALRRERVLWTNAYRTRAAELHLAQWGSKRKRGRR